MGVFTHPALRYVKSLQSFNPIPYGCVFYAPLWSPSLSGPVFKSVDPFGHLCTVTGALYKGDTIGREFDGTDDMITVPDSVGIQDIFDGGGTAIAWINPDSDGEGDNGRILEKDVIWMIRTTAEASSKVKLKIIYYFSGANLSSITDATVVTIGTPACIAFTYDNGDTGNEPIFYVDGVAKAATVGASPSGARDSDVGQDLFVGAATGGTFAYDGKQREAWLYNRILSADELLYITNMTRRG